MALHGIGAVALLNDKLLAQYSWGLMFQIVNILDIPLTANILELSLAKRVALLVLESTPLVATALLEAVVLEVAIDRATVTLVADVDIAFADVNINNKNAKIIVRMYFNFIVSSTSKNLHGL